MGTRPFVSGPKTVKAAVKKEEVQGPLYMSPVGLAGPVYKISAHHLNLCKTFGMPLCEAGVAQLPRP